MLKHICAAIFIVPTAACSQTTDNPNLVREVAAQVKQDCLSARSQAPNAAFAHHLERMCECTESKILASQARNVERQPSDRREALNRAVQAAIKACDEQLGGIADAEDYRATGTKAPVSPTPH